MEAIVASIDPLFTVLIEDSTSDPIAQGILKFVTTFSFLAITHLLADTLSGLARLSKQFQQSQVDFITVTDGVSVTVATLSAFKTTPGPKLTEFVSEIPAPSPTSQSFYYQGHYISDSKKQRDNFVTNQSNLINKIIDNLKSCFPEVGIIGSFAILDPQNLPSPSNLPSWQ